MLIEYPNIYQKTEKGIIEHAKYYVEPDHDVLTCSIGVSGSGWGQGFGGIVLDEKRGPSFCADLCETFFVNQITDLVGKKCIAYYVTDSWNEMIEAIGPQEECSSGPRIFSINGWRMKHWPDHARIEISKQIERPRNDFYRLQYDKEDFRKDSIKKAVKMLELLLQESS